MKSFISFALAALVLLASCSNEDMGQETNKEVRPQQYSFSSFQYDEVYEIIDGKEVKVTAPQRDMRSLHESYEIVNIVPHFTFLGSILNGNSINKGEYKPVGTPLQAKDKITVSFSLPVEAIEIEPTIGGLRRAVTKAVADRNFTGRQSQRIVYKFKEIERYDELCLAFGAKVNIASMFDVGTKVEGTQKRWNTAMFIDFSQTYFTADMDMPYDGNIFRNEEIRTSYLKANPIYINSVNFGRKAILLAESTQSYRVLSAAIRAAFRAKIIDGEMQLDGKTEEILREAHLQICLIGGEGEDGVRTIEGIEEFKEFIIKGGVYSREVYGAVISFSAAYAHDNSMFVSNYEL